jgi:outer membrane protein assembly factor BamB
LSSYSSGGDIRWQFTTKSNIVSTPSIFAEEGTPTQLYFGDEIGDYYVLWGANGTVANNLQLGVPPSTFTHVRDHASVQGMQTAYFGDVEGTLYAKEVTSGVITDRFSWNGGSKIMGHTYGHCSIHAATRDGIVSRLNPHEFPGGSPTPGNDLCLISDYPGFETQIEGTVSATPITACYWVTNNFPIPTPGGHSCCYMHIIVPTEEGTLVAVASGDSNGYRGKIYCPASDYAVNTPQGEVAWTYASESGAAMSKAAVNAQRTLVFAGDEDGALHAVDRLYGNLVWSYTANGPIRDGVSLDENDNLIFGDASGMVHALTGAGELLWQHDTGSAIQTDIAITENPGLVVVSNNKLTVLK